METWTSPINNTLQKPEGEGWSITGYREVRRAANPNRMGSGFTTVRVPIYGRAAPTPAPPPPPAPVAPPPPPPAPPAPLTPTRTPEPPAAVVAEKEAAKKAADTFSAAIAEMETKYKTSLDEASSKSDEMRREAEERMKELEKKMKESRAAAAAAAASAAAADRPTTVGVKGATGSAGSAMSIARGGTGSAFSRTGLRISGLVV